MGVVATVATTLLGGVVWGAGSATAAPSPYRVVLVLPLTGPAAAQAKIQVQGWDASAKVINAAGGVLGHKVEVSTINSQANPTTGVSLLQDRLSSGPPPNFILPGGSGTTALALVPITQQAGILAGGGLQEASLDNPSKYPLFFSTAAVQATVAAGIAHGIKAGGYKRVGIITSADAFGNSQAAAVEPALKAAGLTVTAVESFPDATTNVEPELQQLQATKPDAVFFEAYGAPAGYLLSSLQKVGWDVPMFGGVGASSSNLATLVPASALTKVKVLVYPDGKYLPPSKRTPSFNKFLSALKSFGPITQPLASASVQYDVLQLVNQAAKQAKSISPKAVAKALEHLKAPKTPPWVTYNDYGYTATQHFASPPVTTFIFVKAGPLVTGMYK